MRMLWKILYDGLLRMALPIKIKLVAYANDVAVVIVAKYIDQINQLLDIAFVQNNQWIDGLNLQLAKISRSGIRYDQQKK